MTAPAGDPPSSDPASGGDVTAPASGLIRSSACDPASGGDITAPASDPVRSAARIDFLRNLFSSSLSDSALLVAAGTASQSFYSPSGPGVLDDNGFLHWENVAFRGSVPKPPGPQNSAEELVNTADQPAEQPAGLPADPCGTPAVPSADPTIASADLANVSAVSSDVSADTSDVSTDPSVPAVLPAVPVDSPAHRPVDQSTHSPVVPPVIVVDDPSTDSTDAFDADPSISSPAPPSGKNRASALPR